MPLSTHDITAPYGLTRVRNTFNTLERHANNAFAPPNFMPCIFTTHPDAIAPQVVWPSVNTCQRTSTTCLSGAATAASVGLGYACMIPTAGLWLLSFLYHQLSTRSTSPGFPSIDVDVEATLGDAVPHHIASIHSFHPSHPSSLSSALSTDSVNDAPRLSSATLDSPSSVASTPYTSSLSADSDSSFEALSPTIDSVSIPESMVVRSPSAEGVPLEPFEAPKRSEIKPESSGIEAEVRELADSLVEEAERHSAQSQGSQPSAVPAPAHVHLAVASDACSNSRNTGEANSKTAADDSKTEGYADSDDDEPLNVVYNPHTRRMYRLGRVLGTGGFSRVVLATDLEGREYAAKIVCKQKVFRRPDGRQNLLYERNIMAKISQLDSPRVVQMVECWEREHEVYFIMVSDFADRLL